MAEFRAAGVEHEVLGLAGGELDPEELEDGLDYQVERLPRRFGCDLLRERLKLPPG